MERCWIEKYSENELVEQADVTVFYIEMLTPSQRTVPAPRDGLILLHAQQPSVRDSPTGPSPANTQSKQAM